MRNRLRLTILVASVAVLGAVYSLIVLLPRTEQTPRLRLPAPTASDNGMVRIPAGSFRMGSSLSPRSDERPVHPVQISEFWIDQREVSNADFSRFVAATDYVTTAERRGSSMAFLVDQAEWQEVVGANWRHPEGPASSIAGRDNAPVVQVSWHDAAAYARWAGKRLLTEAQWEYAARGGLADCEYPWGREERPQGEFQANYWQGWFPQRDLGADRFRYVAACGQYPPNPYGLHDMAGNVWEWCADWHGQQTYQRLAATDPVGPSQGAEKIQRGGSWLCADNYIEAMKVYVRRSASPETSTNHLGFRCAGSPAGNQ